MVTSIMPVPTGMGLDSGPYAMVVPAKAMMATADLYRQFIGVPLSCRAREPIVAVVCTKVLNSPDRVAVTASRRVGTVFSIEIEIRRFDGPLAANDPWIALIRWDLGSLEPGTYQLVVRETILHFTARLNSEMQQEA